MKALLYPFQVPALITMVVCSALLSAAMMIFFSTKGTIDNALLVLVAMALFPVMATTLVMFFNYAVLVLQASMEGLEQAPVISGKQASFQNLQFYRIVIFLGIFIYTAILSGTHINIVLALFVLAACAFLFPVYLINIIRYEDMGKALQWQNIILVFRSLKGVYLLVSLLFYLCFFLVYLFIRNGLDSFITILGAAYMLVFTFHLVGRFIKDYAIEVEVQPVISSKPAMRKTKKALEQAALEIDKARVEEISMEVYRFCRAREFEKAFLYLEEELGKDNWIYDDIFYDQLKDSFYGEFSMAHARAYINRLIKNKKLARAWMVCEQNLQNREGFLVKNSEALISLGQLALSIEQQVAFRKLVEQFIEAFPDDEQVEEVRNLLS